MTEIEQIEQEVEKYRTCRHDQVELRYNTASNGAIMYSHQCLFCGETAGQFISHHKIKNKNNIPPYDKALKEKTGILVEQKSALKEQEFQEGTNRWWNFYNEYMKSIDWLNRRDKVIERDDYRCQGCLDARATQVHHLTYKHLGNEFLFELISLCKNCHTRIHS